MRTMLLMVLLAGCAPLGGTGGRCNATNCGGCCDARGTCQLGNTASSCGARGAACGSCGLGLICSQAMCSVPSASVNTGAGGGSTTSGTGGGHSSGPTGRAWQELTSGTRLRALHVTSADGARAPLTWGLNVNAIFWDSQLSLYCTPVAQGVAAPLCEPLGISFDSSEGGEFVDSACTIPASTANDPADLNRALAAAGLPTSTVTHLRLTNASGRHTYFTAMRVPSGAPRYYRSSETSGCIASGTFDDTTWAAGSSVPATTFATMSVTRE